MARTFDDFNCLGCGINTHLIQEYYMVKDAIWKIVNPKDRGMLCIGCAEHELGRALTPSDFTDCALNKSIKNETPRILSFNKSPRLLNRLGH